MHRHPTPLIHGAAPPRLEKRKNQLPHKQTTEVQELSADYLRQRNQAIKTKTQAAEIELAQRRGELVERKLVEMQASYLLVNLRQRLLNLGVHAHRFTGTEITLARQILREIGLSTLNEIRELPNCAESDWLQKVEEAEGAPGKRTT
jgi:hypothetical protein